MSAKDSSDTTSRFLISLICILLIFILTSIYYFLHEQNSLVALVLDLVPNFLASLLSISVILLFLKFTKKSPASLIEGETNIEFSDREMITSINSKLDIINSIGIKTNNESIEIKQKIKDLGTINTPDDSLKVYSNYRALNWETILSESKQLDIMVIFFDAWMTTYEKQLEVFFSRNGTVRLILPDPDNLESIKSMVDLFPKLGNDPQKLIAKINLTVETISKIYLKSQRSHGEHGALKIFLFKKRLNYPLIIFDHKIAVVSNFEHSSDIRTDCPAVLVNFDQNESLKNFWEKEFAKIIMGSSTIA